MNTNDYLSDAQADLLARQVAARLDQSLRDLPHDISERLRAARTRAVAARRQQVPMLATGLRVQKGTQVLEGGPVRMSFWCWLSSDIALISVV